ncbi:MAG: hypothetical protein WC803_06510 [Sphingomonas sp.]|jgi:hypothetical protein
MGAQFMWRLAGDCLSVRTAVLRAGGWANISWLVIIVILDYVPPLSGWRVPKYAMV